MYILVSIYYLHYLLLLFLFLLLYYYRCVVACMHAAVLVSIDDLLGEEAVGAEHSSSLFACEPWSWALRPSSPITYLHFYTRS